MCLIVFDNYSLNLFNYRLPLVIWLICCLGGRILLERISITLPVIKKFNTHFTCCITCLVLCLNNIYALVFWYLSCVLEYQPPPSLPPLKNTTPSFLLSPLLNLLSAQAPFLGNPSYLLNFFSTNPHSLT